MKQFTHGKHLACCQSTQTCSHVSSIQNDMDISGSIRVVLLCIIILYYYYAYDQTCVPVLGPINPAGFFAPFAIQINVSTANVFSIYIDQ